MKKLLLLLLVSCGLSLSAFCQNINDGIETSVASNQSITINVYTMDYRCIKVAASSPVKSDITVYATVWYSHTPGGEDGIDIVTIPVRLLAGQTRAEEVVPVYIIGDIYSGNLSHYSDTYATYTLRY